SNTRSNTPPPSNLKKSVVINTEKELSLCACHREKHTQNRGFFASITGVIPSLFTTVLNANVQVAKKEQSTPVLNTDYPKTYRIGYSTRAPLPI
ncbi:MAG: hypothetical protein ACREOZ_03185, partial [Gloeomargaritales cyanobacterium]